MRKALSFLGLLLSNFLGAQERVSFDHKAAQTACDSVGNPVVYILKDSLARVSLKKVLANEYAEVYRARNYPGGCFLWERTRNPFFDHLFKGGDSVTQAQRDSVRDNYRAHCPSGKTFCVLRPHRKR